MIEFHLDWQDCIGRHLEYQHFREDKLIYLWIIEDGDVYKGWIFDYN